MNIYQISIARPTYNTNHDIGHIKKMDNRQLKCHFSKLTTTVCNMPLTFTSNNPNEQLIAKYDDHIDTYDIVKD
jgi:hypothetical protein